MPPVSGAAIPSLVQLGFSILTVRGKPGAASNLLVDCGFVRDDDGAEAATQMGETTNQPFQLSFNAALNVEFQGSRVTSDGGLTAERTPGTKMEISAQYDSDLPP
jgi:hypothetical protein